MKKLMLALFVLGSFSSFASEVCNSTIDVSIPNAPYVDTSRLTDTLEIT